MCARPFAASAPLSNPAATPTGLGKVRFHSFTCTSMGLSHNKGYSCSLLYKCKMAAIRFRSMDPVQIWTKLGKWSSKGTEMKRRGKSLPSAVIDNITYRRQSNPPGEPDHFAAYRRDRGPCSSSTLQVCDLSRHQSPCH